MKKVFAFAVIGLLLIQSIAAQIKIISPVEGSWANKQMLILDTDKSGEYFYSINGSDPATFGFAYDGPVILDVEGDVILKVTHNLPNGHTEKAEVNFSVKCDKAYNTSYYDFVYSFYDTGIVYYTSGSNYSIPQQLLYNFNNSKDVFNNGNELSIDENNILQRYIPVTIFDPGKNIKYHYVIKILTQNAGIFSRRDVPFRVENWDTLVFTDNNLLYKLDEEFWGLPSENRVIDRSISHMLYWQSLNFEQGNPIEYFVLPPKPIINSEKLESNALLYSIDAPEDDEYTMSVNNPLEDYQELFTTIGIDTFEGDVISGDLFLDIFSNSVYQGSIPVKYNVNKGPVVAPKITTNAVDFYSLEKVVVNIEGSKDADLYVAVSDPLVIDTVSEELKPGDGLFNFDIQDKYQKVQGNKFSVMLDSVGEGAAFYKIIAYSTVNDKKSVVSEYSVIVDEYNFYFDLTSTSPIQNGTVKNPFTSFKDCVKAVNESRSACIHINGNLIIPAGKHILTANCEFKTQPDAAIIFEPGASIVVQNASLQITDCRIENSASESYQNIIPLIKLENSVLSLFDSLISADFYKNGTVIDASNSVVNVKNCIVSVSAKSYSSFLASTLSKVNIESSTINTLGDICVVVSDNNGNVNLYKNTMKVTGRTGRIAEYFSSEVTMSFNDLKAQFSGKNAISAIYTNKSTKLKENKNEYTGF